jgi:hypothetical protein
MNSLWLDTRILPSYVVAPLPLREGEHPVLLGFEKGPGSGAHSGNCGLKSSGLKSGRLFFFVEFRVYFLRPMYEYRVHGRLYPNRS